MFVELLESLRCPREHDESPLVVTSVRTEARHIMEGTLGCPVCRAEFPISNGEALFAVDAPVPSETPQAEAAMRLAAFLQLTDERSFAVLCGRWGAHAEELRALSPTPLLLINPPARIDVAFTGIIRVGAGRLPVARGAARAAALDAAQLPGASAAALVRPGGRVVGFATQAPPDGIAELARDAGMWVGEKGAGPDDPAPRLVALRRA